MGLLPVVPPLWLFRLLLLAVIGGHIGVVGDVPARCRTPQKRVRALWAKSVYGPKEASAVYCPLREDPTGQLQHGFDAIAGQQDALKVIRAAVMKNVVTEKGPLVLHIAGPSGVGKSLTASSVARAIMKDTESEGSADWCGVTVINGHYYSSVELPRIRRDSRTIMRQIGTQLAVCPRSVVIMEDIQHMHEALLQVGAAQPGALVAPEPWSLVFLILRVRWWVRNAVAGHDVRRRLPPRDALCQGARRRERGGGARHGGERSTHMPPQPYQPRVHRHWGDHTLCVLHPGCTGGQPGCRGGV
jgi:hypothetical protein